MTLDLDDEELTDVREALRLHVLGLLRDLARTDRPRFAANVKARLKRLELLHERLASAAVTGPFSATH